MFGTNYGRFAGLANPAYMPRTFGGSANTLLRPQSVQNLRGDGPSDPTTGGTDTPAVPGGDNTIPAAPAPVTPPPPAFDPNIAANTGLGPSPGFPNGPGGPPAGNPLPTAAMGTAAPTTAQVTANPTGFGASFNPANRDPNISAFLAQQVASRVGGGGDGGATPAGYGTPGFDYTQDPAYAGSFNPNIPNPSQPPQGATPTGVPGVFVLPGGFTWMDPAIDQQQAFGRYQSVARREPNFNWRGIP